LERVFLGSLQILKFFARIFFDAMSAIAQMEEIQGR
jgi:hypothetical protein